MPHTFTTSDPCACCFPCITPTLKCAQRGGTATLCGFSEFTSPSTPPRKYRKSTINYDLYYCVFSCSSGCSGLNAVERDRFQASGVASYDPNTCVFTGAPGRHYQDFPSGASCIAPSILVATFAAGSFYLDTNVVVQSVLTQTTRSAAARPPCYNFSGDTCVMANVSSDTETLSDEDTEDDAIARLLTSVGDFPAFSLCSTPDTCCRAAYQQRTSGFSFEYEESRWQLTESGLIPGITYVAYVNYYRRAYGTVSYMLYATDPVYMVADGSGNVSATGDVPNDKGYETYASEGSCP